ncbi:MAG: hypothetical protein NTY61_00215 [Candidatus Parcubacteria bacterium]|nr:hypothetical protein [Candidatus Parcubacteria bacterium]
MKDRPKASLNKIVHLILSVVCLAAIIIGGLYVVDKTGDIGRGFLVVTAIVVGVMIFLNHLDDLINSKAPLLCLFLLFASLSAWGILIPIPAQGIWGGSGSLFSLILLFPLAEFFWDQRKMWYKKQISSPIFWMFLLWVGYIDHIIEGPWSNVKIVLISIRGVLMVGLLVAFIGRLKLKWATCLNVR